MRVRIFWFHIGANSNLEKLYADGVHQRPEFQKAVKRALFRIESEIIKLSDRQKSFVVPAMPGVVERARSCLD